MSLPHYLAFFFQPMAPWTSAAAYRRGEMFAVKCLNFFFVYLKFGSSHFLLLNGIPNCTNGCNSNLLEKFLH